MRNSNHSNERRRILKALAAGGTLAITGSSSIGASAPGNGIALSGGGKLSYIGATALDLGTNRSISVATGGGISVPFWAAP